jgi:hypothetical protein
MRTIKTETKILTPQDALEILKCNSRNRPMSKPTVMFYEDQLRRGLWKFNGVPIIIGEGNVLLDGQHRLAAIVKSGISQQCLIVYGIDPNTFDTIDVGKSRSGADMLNIVNVKNSVGVSAIISSYYVLLNKNYVFQRSAVQTRLSKNEIVSNYLKSPDFWQDIFKQASRCNLKIKLLKISLIGGMMVYLIKDKKHNEAKVISFFEQLFFDTNIENTSIAILRDKLLKDITGQYKMTSKYKLALIIKAWNYYITGKDAKLLYYNSEKEPMPEFN